MKITCIQNGYTLDTQDRIDKDRIDKERIDKISKEKEKEKEENYNSYFVTSHKDNNVEQNIILFRKYFSTYFDLTKENIFNDFTKISSFIKINPNKVLEATNNALKQNIKNTKYILNTLENWKKENKLSEDIEDVQEY